MKYLKKLLPAIAFFSGILMSANVFAEGEFDQFIRKTFEVNFNEMSQTNNPQLFLNAFADDLSGSIIQVAIDGKTTRSELTKPILAKYVQRYNLPGATYSTWKIDNLNNGVVRENTYAVFFGVTVQTWAGDSVISTAKNLVQVVAKKYQGKIKITFISITSVEKKVHRGSCYVSFENKEGGQFISETAYPNGRDYSAEENKFYFVGEGNVQVVKLDSVETNYYWFRKKGEVKLSKSAKTSIGNATNRNECMLIILNELYKQKCTKVVRVEVKQ